MKTVLPLLVGFALLGCSPSASPPASPSGVSQPSASPPAPDASAPWTLAFTAEATGERCELSKRQTLAELRCGNAAFAPVKSDAAEAVRLIEGVAWADEAARREPEEAGTKARSFKLTYPQGAVEVFRYAAPSTPFGRLSAALDALVQAEKPAPPEPREPRAFPDVADSGLVTMQTIALVGAARAVTVRVAADGAWTRSGTAPSSGKLDPKQLSAVRALVDEVAKAKRSTEAGLPCDALPVQASRLLFAGRELGWGGPCAGPPPPASAATLATYLHQVADGRPANELEQTLARPR
jgi:hypothetical protein